MVTVPKDRPTCSLSNGTRLCDGRFAAPAPLWHLRGRRTPHDSHQCECDRRVPRLSFFLSPLGRDYRPEPQFLRLSEPVGRLVVSSANGRPILRNECYSVCPSPATARVPS